MFGWILNHKIRVIIKGLGNSHDLYKDDRIAVRKVWQKYTEGIRYTVDVGKERWTLVYDCNSDGVSAFRKGLWMMYIDQLYRRAKEEAKRKRKEEREFKKKQRAEAFSPFDDREIFPEFC